VATAVETLAADTLRTTARGHSFIAPVGWSLRAAGPMVVLTAPEGDSRIAVIDAAATDPDAAVAAAWAAYDAKPRWPLKQASDRPARNGWAQQRAYQYDAPADTKRTVFARAFRHEERWTVVLGDLSQTVVEMRESQLTRILGRLWAKGYAPETFAGKAAHKLEGARLLALTQFIDEARQSLDVPGVALGIVQDGKVVFAGGFGVRELGKPDKVDAETLFLSASVTKPLTSLMLAKQVDTGRFGWDTPVTQVLPSFRFRDAELTRKVQMKHLLCACTGLPRQDMESIFASEGATAAWVVELVAKTEPTAAFGELYQYSNPVAAIAGYTGGHAQYPKLELGAAYDAAMQTLVFDPLAMTATTFDFTRALAGNHAEPHARDIHGTTVRVSMDFNYTNLPMRPDGGAWSSVNDLLRYVQMELASGRLPDGRRYIGAPALHARTQPQVPRGGDQQWYGMGLKIDRNQGTPSIWHGGNTAGYQSEVWWLPEHGVGTVLLTNANAGVHLRELLRRRVTELLFDAKPEAPAMLATLPQKLKNEEAADRSSMTTPADPALTAGLATRYRNTELGDIEVVRKGATTWFDFGVWESEVGTRRNPDGGSALVTMSPSVAGFAFNVTDTNGRRALVLRDGKLEYVFAATE
jgi:CubicO group peptidase (beta-lactamase class C family)